MLNIYVDRGGTFTDLYYEIEGKPYIDKVLSLPDGVIDGIRKIPGPINKVIIGTTIVTNAILERKGAKCALLITKGFRDLLYIGQQTRPKIFDLTMRRPDVLYTEVYEIEERLDHDGNIITPLCVSDIQAAIEQCTMNGIDSIAIVFIHSHSNPAHEQIAQEICQKRIKYVTCSSQSSKSIKVVPRGQTTLLDAYTNPILQDYITHIKNNIKCNELLFMTSDGSLVSDITGSKALLSGPAGGVVAMMSLTGNRFGKKGVVGFDMGGTSTDVCVYYDKVPSNDESIIDDIFVHTPCFDIQTIASGGGSLLKFEHGMFKVGPESSGSDPGPVCYGRGGKLSLTDANLIVGNITRDQLPAHFGPSYDSPLDLEATKIAFQQLAEQLKMPIEQIARNFIKVAEEQMSRPIRSVTNGRGKQSSDHLLFVFGGAGAQHCCSIADLLGIDTIYIHKYASVLSAYGLSKAQKNQTICIPYISKLNETIFSKVEQYKDQEIQLQLKYEGSDFLISIDYDQDIEVIQKRFHQQHEELFGFTLNKDIYIDYIQVREKSNLKLQMDDIIQLPLTQGQNKHLNKMAEYNYLGPCLIYTGTTTINVPQGWSIQKTLNQNLLLKRQTNEIQKIECPILKLTIFANRFMAIAEEMGKQLQNTSVSVNIKERLDFSCAIFDSDGNLVANAPHLPVHLGSMSDAIKCQIPISEGDVVISNHPSYGGSHLPDITAISPYYENGQILFYVASRGHHADIGGISPGSMPSYSQSLSEEGIAIKSFKIIKNNEFQTHTLTELLSESREISDNISDLKAQIAANTKGIQLLKSMIKEFGIDEVKEQMRLIQINAEKSVKEMLCRMSITNGMKELDSISEFDYMDDGSIIKLKLTIDRVLQKVIFDFSGTSSQVIGNINCPKSVTKSAIIYSLRCLIDSEIPLNQGCLNCTEIIIPQNSLLSPHESCAIVGGNVLTSQRITDIILKCFKAVAASQGCMNNFSFGGNGTHSYYETICGGGGAGPNFHGQSGVQVHMTNTRITDVEVFERKYPVRIIEFKLRSNSGGLGKFHGGDGVIRTFEFLTPIQVSLLTERRVFAPFGICQGEHGAKGINILHRNNQNYQLPGKITLKVLSGDRITIQTPGGGGYGNI